jgi:hypothetical protein
MLLRDTGGHLPGSPQSTRFSHSLPGKKVLIFAFGWSFQLLDGWNVWARKIPRFRASKGHYLASKAGEFRQTGRLCDVFSTRTGKGNFAGVSKRGRDPEYRIGARYEAELA